MSSDKNVSYKIKHFSDPEVFLALKKMCQYLVSNAWESSTIGFGEAEAEFNLAVERTKRYEVEVKILAEVDEDLAWGQTKRKTKDGLFVTTNAGDFNPWYEGELTLQELLDSMDLLIDALSSTEPRYLEEAEFIHYYYFLSSKLPKNYPEPAVINIDSLHQKIKEHCSKRFNNRQYSDAILAAYKVVLKEIQEISGIQNLDGKRLVEKVFSLDNPIIKLNPLVSQSDKDEQQGFMLLFSGAAVGIRNPKAHDLVIQEDKQKTLRYLAFASLLMERLDERFKPHPEDLR